MSDEHYPEWQGVDWGRSVEEMIDHRRKQVEMQMGQYRVLYPTHDDAIVALIHNKKVIDDLEEQVAELKAKNKRLKKILRRAIK